MTTAVNWTVLFDLDGTLVNSAPDLVDAVNDVRQHHGLNQQPYATLAPLAGHGGAVLLEDTLKDLEFKVPLEQLRTQFLHFYQRRIQAPRSELYPGIGELLQRWHTQGTFKLGIVTNKPIDLARPLVNALKIHSLFDCLIGSQMPGTRLKPAPDSLLLALRTLQVQKGLYVGDADSDMVAAHAAGLKGIFVTWGYGSLTAAHHADEVAHNVSQLENWVARQIFSYN